MKRITFSLIQPATLGLILVFWANAPVSLIDNAWTITLASIGTLAMVQGLEFINERHPSWRMSSREFFTDLFYLILFYSVILYVETKLAEEPLTATKHALGITTAWAMHLPFIVQVALTLFLIEFGQYWMHRLMHNSFLWWTHAPHHHITQLNAAKGLVGNPIELFLVSLSVISLFDLPQNAIFCALNIITAVSGFAHANVRFNPPRWYAYLFTTVEAHSLHHSVSYYDTRCNYANALILCDRLCGTFRAGEGEVVGQDERKRLSIRQQFMFPFRPLLTMFKAKNGPSASTVG